MVILKRKILCAVDTLSKTVSSAGLTIFISTEPSCPQWICQHRWMSIKWMHILINSGGKTPGFIRNHWLYWQNISGQSPSLCSHNVVRLSGWCFTVKHSHKTSREKKKRNVGQRWPVRRINVQREKHWRVQAAGPAPGWRETRGRLSGF